MLLSIKFTLINISFK